MGIGQHSRMGDSGDGLDSQLETRRCRLLRAFTRRHGIGATEGAQDAQFPGE